MKYKYIFWVVFASFVILIMSFTFSSSSPFYYAFNEKTYLNVLENKLIIRYNQNKNSDIKQLSISHEFNDKVIKWEDDSTCIVTASISDIKALKDKIMGQSDVKTINQLYSLDLGFEMGVTDEFVVKFKDGVSLAKIQSLTEKYDVVEVEKTDLYTLFKVKTGIDALEMANKFQESGLTIFSYPNFLSKLELCQQIPNDQFFPNQFYLNNTGQVFTDGHSGTNDADIDAPEAWSFTKGNSNITIAVLDEGITSNHYDLPNTRQTRLNGSNFGDGNSNDPSPSGNMNHGNACAGIAAATQDNNEGISGVAPNCKIMPIRIFNSNGNGITETKLASAIDFARSHGADVISNSWVYGSANPNLFPVIVTAISNATTQGRNGKGCVVVFAAGNNYENDGPVHFPSNVNVLGVLTIGASDRYEAKAYYSPLGNPTSPNNQVIDVVAPSHRAYSFQMANETREVWSIDIPNLPGYNDVKETDGGNLPVVGSQLPNNGVNYLSYTGRMGGTSASCPQVAAVAALILSIKPDLTQQQVFDMIISSADKVGGYTYTNDGRSNELGFGRLCSYEVVVRTTILTLPISGPSTACPGVSFKINNLPTGYHVNWSGSLPSRYTVTQAGDSCIFTNIYQAGTIQLIATVTDSHDTATLSRNVYLSYTPDYYAIYGQLTTGGSTNWLEDYNCLLDYTFPGMYHGFIDILDPESQPHIDNVTWTKIWQSQGTSFAAIGGSEDGKHVTAIIKPVGMVAIFRMTATNSCGSFSYDYTFVAGESSLCSGIEMMTIIPQISVFPNPTTGIVNIEYKSEDIESGIKELIVTNTMGMNLLRKKYNNQKTISLDISNQIPGFYYIEIFDGKNWTCHQISIKK